MTAAPNESQRDQSLPPGALLNAGQIRLLKRAILVMSVVLVAGFIAVLGRIGYLMTRKGEPALAAPSAASAAPAGTVPAAALLEDVRLGLPVGATVKSAALADSRLLVHHTGPAGDGFIVLDLATGRVLSRIRTEPAQRP